jgi:hypothetical protein
LFFRQRLLVGKRPRANDFRPNIIQQIRIMLNRLRPLHTLRTWVREVRKMNVSARLRRAAADREQ